MKKRSSLNNSMIYHNNLEEFQDPENYDLEEINHVNQPIAFYGSLAKEYGGPVLEVACGSGLVAIPIASQGFVVTGVDICKPMLEHARIKARRLNLNVEWIEADARKFDLGKVYRLIYMTGNAFQAFLGRKNQDAMLSAVKRHLEADSIFAFETRNPSGHDLETQVIEEEWYTYTNAEGNHVRVSGTQKYDGKGKILHWTTYRRWQNKAGNQEKETHIACQFTTAKELATVLHENGYEIMRQFGGFNMEKLTEKSPSIITVCKLQSRK